MLFDFLAGWQVGVLAGCLVGRVARWQVGCLAGWLVDRLASLLVGRLAIQYDTIQYNYILITLRCAHPADPSFLTLSLSIWASWASFGPPGLHLGLLGSIWASWTPLGALFVTLAAFL